MSACEIVLYGILVLLFVENLIEIWISMRQVKVYKTALEIPKELTGFISDETFHKSRLYGLDQENYGIIKTFIMNLVVVCLELCVGYIAWLWNISINITERMNWDAKNEIIVSTLFVILLSVISFFKEMPFKIYKIFVLEERHGFNKQTVRFFLCDQIKGFLIGQALIIPINAAMIVIVRNGGDNFFIWLWLFSGSISLALLTVYPIFIAPLFDTYTPLENGPLRSSIENLAASLNFPLTKLYVVEGSRRSSHSNAYFYGLWNSKRIVLFDTLLLNNKKPTDTDVRENKKIKGCTDEEVLAILGHELGHWKLGHVMKNMFIMQMHLLFLFIVFGNCFNFTPFYEALGFKSGTRPVLVGLLVVFTYIMAPYNALVSFGLTMLSRHFEYQADEFAHKLGFSQQLAHSLIKLNTDNLGFPVYDYIYSSWNHSHPTLLQRLDRLQKLDQTDNKKCS